MLHHKSVELCFSETLLTPVFFVVFIIGGGI